MGDTQIVYYFDEPTIGFCQNCEAVAIYRDGLICPKCGTRELSIFVWDKNSRHPEAED